MLFHDFFFFLSNLSELMKMNTHMFLLEAVSQQLLLTFFMLHMEIIVVHNPAVETGERVRVCLMNPQESVCVSGGKRDLKGSRGWFGKLV